MVTRVKCNLQDCGGGYLFCTCGQDGGIENHSAHFVQDLLRGVLYTTVISLNCNKIALGHHRDDALETLLLNMIHSGVMKGMPPRYTSTSRERPLAIIRPLLSSLEEGIAQYASLARFPILPCNLCINQANLQRPQVKLLLGGMERLSPNAKKNMILSMMNVRPSLFMDSTLRQACGLRSVTGE
mmetsp:Transcript_9642/g.17536  ORF Transcript_9642/g.17536 Transcript_9642/m.17536 type:complete len:184 (-) Transcript_9642:418-969(-)